MKIDQVVDHFIKEGSIGPQEIMAAVTSITEADDLTGEERSTFLSGYMMGLAFSAQKSPTDIATELLMRICECEMGGML